MDLFLKRFCLFAAFGVAFFVLISFGYFFYDPFKVIHDHSSFSKPSVIYNRDFVSTEMFLRNRERYRYDSFIFGSSRTIAFKPASWQKHLPSGSRIFMFDASGESVYGIYRKLLLIEKLNVKIKNALIVICRDAAFDNSANHKGHLYIKHPAVSGENKLRFHWEFFKAYLDPAFMLSYYRFQFTKKYDESMSQHIEKREIIQDPVTNEIHILDQEREIATNERNYYSRRKDLFYERQGEKVFLSDRIDQTNTFMLEEIKRILEKNNANYKIVISPLYEQVTFSKKDLEVLRRIFGNHLFDFSGKNRFTDPVTNFYETSHYRPAVGDSILRIIYSK